MGGGMFGGGGGGGNRGRGGRGGGGGGMLGNFGSRGRRGKYGTKGGNIGINALVPKIKISQHKPINPQSTFSAPFIISNNGNITIYNVKSKFILILAKEMRKGGVIFKNLTLNPYQKINETVK